ncbi:MAG TPA: purine-nucleoside phosphorylase [Epulopiscium sp.]|nr:purine-nucleoside phosphorylase [Candidatus Epulonipiscium sp.]
MEIMINNIQESADYIQSKMTLKPTIAVILGSGLGDLADEIQNSVKIPYTQIPHFPISTVVGHAGQLLIGELEGKTILAMQGRFHYYEGYPMTDVTYAIRVMKQIGIEKLIVTNAAGAVDPSFVPGDLMLISDHINLSGSNPLIGRNMDSFGVRFPDMSNAYSLELRDLASKVAKGAGIDLKEGVYTFMSGPTYETPAEVRMIRLVGGDAVGMSTAPEVIVAVHSGIEVVGISCLTNMAAGILDQPLNHEEVVETSQRVKSKFTTLIKGLLGNM